MKALLLLLSSEGSAVNDWPVAVISLAILLVVGITSRFLLKRMLDKHAPVRSKIDITTDPEEILEEEVL